MKYSIFANLFLNFGIIILISTDPNPASDHSLTVLFVAGFAIILNANMLDTYRNAAPRDPYKRGQLLP